MGLVVLVPVCLPLLLLLLLLDSLQERAERCQYYWNVEMHIFEKLRYQEKEGFVRWCFFDSYVVLLLQLGRRSNDRRQQQPVDRVLYQRRMDLWEALPSLLTGLLCSRIYWQHYSKTLFSSSENIMIAEHGWICAKAMIKVMCLEWNTRLVLLESSS